jgi:hypothetical protein
LEEQVPITFFLIQVLLTLVEELIHSMAIRPLKLQNLELWVKGVMWDKGVKGVMWIILIAPMVRFKEAQMIVAKDWGIVKGAITENIVM